MVVDSRSETINALKKHKKYFDEHLDNAKYTQSIVACLH